MSRMVKLHIVLLCPTHDVNHLFVLRIHIVYAACLLVT